jgi:hypothetical protein
MVKVALMLGAFGLSALLIGVLVVAVFSLTEEDTARLLDRDVRR